MRLPAGEQISRATVGPTPTSMLSLTHSHNPTKMPRSQERAAEPHLLDAVLRAVETRLKPNHRVDLPALCDQIALPAATDDPQLTKRQYICSRLAKITTQAKLNQVATSFVKLYPLGAHGNEATFQIEELLWEDDHPLVSFRLRRELAATLDQIDLFLDADEFMQLLASLFVLDPDGLWAERDSLDWKIRQHFIRNPEDWSVLQLFDEIGALRCSSQRFRRLIEALASPQVRPDEASQRSFVEVANSALTPAGMELIETGEVDGYPDFTIASSGEPRQRRPKNLIFASRHKPDLRFRDAVNNDIEVVTHSDDVLVFDEPIQGGLLWRDLQSWWARLQGIENGDAAKRSLYKRLRSSLPKSSPPQQLLFRSFYSHFAERVPDLPALLPEVWLHYDPKTVMARGRDALLRQRMDYLMLLQSGVRVVIEVDGQHHYSSGVRPDPARYAAMAMADRDLKLCGYDVYRFGAHELANATGESIVAAFFDDLFQKHGVR